MRPDRIPLFPLNVVLLPGADLPLHIFEPRYLEMVSRCLKEKSEFGVLLALPKGVARVGCTAEIIEAAKRDDDETMDILTVGREPFRVIEFFEENPLAEGQVDYLEDRETRVNPAMRRELIELYETCHTLIFEDYPKNTDSDASPIKSRTLSQARCRWICSGSSKSSSCGRKRTGKSASWGISAPGRRIYTRQALCASAPAVMDTD